MGGVEAYQTKWAKQSKLKRRFRIRVLNSTHLHSRGMNSIGSRAISDISNESERGVEVAQKQCASELLKDRFRFILICIINETNDFNGKLRTTTTKTGNMNLFICLILTKIAFIYFYFWLLFVIRSFPLI